MIIPLMLGIIIGEFYPIPFLEFGIAILLIPFIFSFFKEIKRGGWFFGITVYLLLFILGHSLVQLKDERNKKDYFEQFLTQDKNEIIGLVNSMPTPGNPLRVNLKIESIKTENQWEKASGNLSLNIKLDTLATQLEYGDRIILSSWINSIPQPNNPEAFDYSRYQHFQNIHYNSYLKEGSWKILEKNKGSPFYYYSYKLRKKAIKVLKKHLITSNEFAVGSALLLGYKDEITDEVKLAYSGTGAMHVLAVSGLHVGILFAIIQFIFALFKRQDKKFKTIELTLSLLLIWGFAFITGASPSVLRAATMFSFLAIGNFLSRNNNTYNTLASSAFFILLLNPYLLFNPGFQLSYLAVIGIVFFHPLIHKSWYVENRFGKYIWEMTSVSIAAQITTLPISLYYFDQFPSYFIFSGLIVIPAAGLIMKLGMILLLLQTFIPFLASFIGFILNKIIWIMNALIFILEKAPYSLVEHIHFSFGQMVFSYIAIAFLAIWLKKDIKKFLWVFLAILGFILSIQSIRKLVHQDREEIVFYDTKGHLIDYFENGKRITIKNEELTEKSEDFAAKGYRTFSNHSEELESEKYFINGSFLQIADKKFYLLDENYYDLRSMNKIQVNGIIIQNNVFVNLAALSEEFDFDFILVDGSNKKSKVEFIRKKCLENNIEFRTTAHIIKLK